MQLSYLPFKGVNRNVNPESSRLRVYKCPEGFMVCVDNLPSVTLTTAELGSLVALLKDDGSRVSVLAADIKRILANRLPEVVEVLEGAGKC